MEIPLNSAPNVLVLIDWPNFFWIALELEVCKMLLKHKVQRLKILIRDRYKE
jgi:hypothetical protein